MKYLGSLDDLKALLNTLPITGTWHSQSNGNFMFRCSTGAILHFSTTKFTVWFDGDDEANADLYELIVDRLRANATRARLLAKQHLVGSEHVAKPAAPKVRKILRVVREPQDGR